MMDRQQSADSLSGESIGYRLGFSLRILVLGFFTSVVGLLIASGVDSSWRMPVVYASLGFGALSLFAAFVGRIVRAVPWGVYVLLVGVGSLLQGLEPRPDAALIAIAAGTVVAAACAVVLLVIHGRRTRELDRMLFTEATSVAFFVTMVSALSYALLEAWIEAPKLSMWFVWTVGMGAWIVASTVFRRRYS
jgi:hypothetical protein